MGLQRLEKTERKVQKCVRGGFAVVERAATRSLKRADRIGCGRCQLGLPSSKLASPLQSMQLLQFCAQLAQRGSLLLHLGAVPFKLLSNVAKLPSQRHVKLVEQSTERSEAVSESLHVAAFDEFEHRPSFSAKRARHDGS